jgi:hypothetical protein
LAGVPADTLTRLRAACPQRSLVMPLVVLADLLARQVPQATASSVVYTVTAAGLRDDELSLLRQYVERDIAAGASPQTAARVRSDGILMLHGTVRLPTAPTTKRGAAPRREG